MRATLIKGIFGPEDRQPVVRQWHINGCEHLRVTRRSNEGGFHRQVGDCRKESWESIYWLQLAIATEVVTQQEVAWELDEAQQLKAMITAAIKTGQNSNWRGGT